MMKDNRLGRILSVLKGLGWRRWILLGVNLLLLAAMGASLAGLEKMRSTPSTLSAARRFQGDGETRFAQLAVFMPEGKGKSEEDIQRFRQSLDGTLVEQSLEAPENGSLTIDAYCGFASVTVSSENTTGSSVKAAGVGGDFFYFHPLQLRSGSYIRSGDIMDDLVVLDEETAWRIFGGTDLTGMTVTINDKAFVVGGVVHREDDFASKRAYSGEGGIFLSFTALTRLLEDTRISCYEIVMPDPISGFAKGLVSDVFPVGNGDVVQNSGRYSPVSLLTVLKNFPGRSMRLNGVIYPYWENAARLTEDYAALLLLAAAVFLLIPLLFLITAVIRYVRWTYRFAKAKIPEKVEEAVEKHREERLEKKLENKAGGDGDG